MARRNNQISIAAGPTWVDVFRSVTAGGDDGRGTRDLLLTCAADSANPIEYRVDEPQDPDDEQATLAPGEAVRIRGVNQLIHHIVMRGVGGGATGGVEVLSF